MTAPDRASRAALLRQAFDASFAQRPPAPVDDTPALAVHLGPDVVAVPLAGLVSVVTDRVVVPLPGSSPDRSGIAAVRGDLVSVHSLAVLLGRVDPARGPRTLLMVDGTAAVALAVDRVGGQIRLPRSVVDEGDGGALRAATASDGARWLVVDLGVVMSTLRARSGARPGGDGDGR